MSDVTIWAEARLPGFHRWPGATGQRSYLADRHRHMFHIRATVAVAHDERDVEFHDLRQVIADWWGPGERECEDSSCEALARDLAHHLTYRVKLQVRQVGVSEDGECGATVTVGGCACGQ